MLDTVHRVETPEGVDLTLRIAGPAPRAVAWLVDLALRVAIGAVLSVVLTLFGQLGAGILLIVMFTLEWVYPVAFEVWGDGATPGKRLLHLRVVHRDGTPVGLSASSLRNLLRAADFLPALYILGLISTWVAGDFRRLGDLAAGTLVVYADVTRTRLRLPAAEPHPPPLPLSLSEQRVLIGLAQRAGNLPPARTMELVGVAQPLIAASPTRVDDAEKYLTGIAAWLSGHRRASARSAVFLPPEKGQTRS